MQPQGLGTAERLRLLVQASTRPEIDSGYLELAGEVIAQCASDALLCSRVSLWLLSADQSELRCIAMVINGTPRSAAPALGRAFGYPEHFAALLANQTIRAEDAWTHPATREFADAYLKPKDVRSVLVYPLRAKGRVAGGIYCGQSAATRRWTDEDEAFLNALAEVAVRALTATERAAAEDKLILANTHLEREVAERTARLTQALDDLRFTQRQLVENEKMAALGSLVAGVAHEINTPIGIGITALSHLLDEHTRLAQHYSEGKMVRADFEAFLGTVKEGADIALRNLSRSAELIKSFRRVAVHQSDERLERFDLVLAVEDVVKSVGPEMRKRGLEVVIDAPSPVPVVTYIGALEQVLTNLLINAVRHAFDRKAHGRIRVGVRGGRRHAHLTVTDDGDGIDPQILPHIFEPFVTTKRDAGGTGLGLAITYNLVAQQLRGRITVESKPGVGSAFWVSLPLDLNVDAPAPLQDSHHQHSVTSGDRRDENQ
jgi:signal transduction histidine kinase